MTVKHIAILGLSGLLVSCGSHEEKKEEYGYKMEQNGCKTGSHKFSSKKAMCAGLQNNSLNKGCAEDLRQAYFQKNCSGTFNSSDTNVAQHGGRSEGGGRRTGPTHTLAGGSGNGTGGGDVTVNEIFEVRKLAVGESVMEVPWASTQGTNFQESELTFVSCENSIASARRSQYNGFILVAESQVVIARDTNHRFGDGTTASKAKPYAFIVCGEKNIRASSDEATNYVQRILNVGDSLVELVKTSPKQASEIRSMLVTVACRANKDQAAQSADEPHGITLLPGSKLVAFRDPSEGPQGTTPVEGGALSLITCK